MKEDGPSIAKPSPKGTSGKGKIFVTPSGKSLRPSPYSPQHLGKSPSSRIGGLAKFLSSSMLAETGSANSESELPKLPEKRRVSIQLVMFPKASVRMNAQTSLNVTFASLGRQNTLLDLSADIEDPNNSILPQPSENQKLPTLLTSVGAVPANTLKNLSSPKPQQIPIASMAVGPFLPMNLIKNTEEYAKVKTKLTAGDRLATLCKHLNYNGRSIDKYKNAINKKNKQQLDQIVEQDLAGPEYRCQAEVKVMKKQVQEEDSEEEIGLGNKVIARDLFLTWHPRKEMFGGPLEFREGRKICAKGYLAYILGGYSTGGNQYDTLFCYDASTNALKACQTGKTFPPPRAHFSMVHVNNSLYIFGGEMIKRSVSLLAYDDVWRYDFSTMKFRQIRTPSRIEGRKHHAACAYGNNYFLVYGGVNDHDQVLCDLQVFVLSTLF